MRKMIQSKHSYMSIIETHFGVGMQNIFPVAKKELAIYCDETQCELFLCITVEKSQS